MRLLQLTSITCLVIIWTIGAESKEFKSPQYIESGSAGIIQCPFREDVFTVLWYNSTEFSPVNAILSFKNSVKSGGGFDSGEFDVYPNGSLIINNVSIKYEGTYTVIELETPKSEAMTYTVRVLVIAKTFDRLPSIDKCNNKSGICFQRFDQSSGISCTVRDARPAIPLSWMIRTIDGDLNISSRLVITNASNTYFTSRVTTNNPFVYSMMLTLLVCNADGPPGLFERNESIVLLQNSNETLTNVKPKQILVENDSRVLLPCTNSQISYLVWQVKQFTEVAFKTILYVVFAEGNLTQIIDKDYKLHNNSSVIVDKVGVHHEGTYRCISGNGFEDDLLLYDVVVFVFPDPAYPVVDRCDHRQYCVLEVNPEGNLTCTVKRIFPQVNLDISKVFESSSNALHFYDKKITIRDNGDTFDVLLTSKYRFNGAAESRVTVECKVIGTNIDELHLSTKLDLLFLHAEDPFQYTTATTEAGPSSDEYNYWIIAVALVVVLIFLVAGGLVLFKVCCRRYITSKRECSAHRTIPLVETERVNNGVNAEGRSEMQNRADPEEVIPMIAKSDHQGTSLHSKAILNRDENDEFDENELNVIKNR